MDIKDLAQQFTEVAELQKYSNSQYVALVKAQEKIKSLEMELELLKRNPDLIIKSTEQSICEIQIERLRETAMQRSLTLEETKRLDLLVKNLILSKESNKDIKPDYNLLPEGLTEKNLMEVASNKEKH